MTKRKKGQMARTLVWVCLVVLISSLIWAAVITTIAAVQGGIADVSPVLTFAATVFGGELLMLLMKRIFAKNIEEEPYET